MKIMMAVLYGLIGWFSIKNPQTSFNKVKNIAFLFDNDSGFISKPQASYLLKKLSVIRQIDPAAGSYLNDFDTLGKYYRSSLTGNYILCITDLQTDDFETHVLIELKPVSKGSFEVISTERYLHGNYACCWNNLYEGFRKTGNFFTLKICGTGSSFCNAHQYVFQKVQAQKDLAPIYTEMFAMWDSDTAFIFTSDFNVNHSQLNVQYEFRLEKYVEINDSTAEFQLIGITDSFNVVYQWINEKWLPSDSTYLKKHEVLQY